LAPRCLNLPKAPELASGQSHKRTSNDSRMPCSWSIGRRGGCSGSILKWTLAPKMQIWRVDRSKLGAGCWNDSAQRQMGPPALPDVPPEAVAAPDLARQIRQWQAWLKIERRYSSHTLAAYRRDLWAFLNFLARHNGALPSVDTLRQFGRSDLRPYLLDRGRRDLKASSTARAFAVVRSFFDSYCAAAQSPARRFWLCESRKCLMVSPRP
jgi:Phage integrase, N-terminal SAM-like domain